MLAKKPKVIEEEKPAEEEVKHEENEWGEKDVTGIVGYLIRFNTTTVQLRRRLSMIVIFQELNS